jgi:crotonobetainyl-CoA:carnitine CoA-transferase CaiB-like acyl-CoA transferase
MAKIPGIPLDMDGRKPRIRQQPPEMGAQGRAVLAEAGFGAAEIDALVAQGVVVEPGTAAQKRSA